MKLALRYISLGLILGTIGGTLRFTDYLRNTPQHKGQRWHSC